MTRKRDRFFALMGALLFLVTSAALTVAVVWQSTQSDSTDSAAATNSQSKVPCQQVASPQPTLPKPEAYKATSTIKTLLVTDLQPGSGPAAKDGECLVMKYYGSLASNGKVFDENFTKPTAFVFRLGNHEVIPGWDQGLVGMKAGGERRLVIPSSLGYGAGGACQVQDSKDPSKCDQYAIPPNSDLVFVVKLLKINQQ